MPKISDAHREMRRAQILDAAWRCFQREGVQATRMEHIVAESGLAPSAMYRYFRNKDDIILAAIETSMRGLSALLQPLVEAVDDGGPGAYVERVAETIRVFSRRSGFDLMSIGVHGWSEAQRSPAVKALLSRYYRAFRDRLAVKAARWQAAGEADASADPRDIAQAVFGIVLGHVVQCVVIDADTDARRAARGLAALGGPWRVAAGRRVRARGGARA